MHAARLDSSPRLQRTLEVIRAHPGGCTTLELVLLTGSCAVHSDVAELRAEPNKIPISCRYERTVNGRRVYRYRLEEAA